MDLAATSRLTRRSALRGIGAALLGGAAVVAGGAVVAAPPAEAQNNPLVGSWSGRTNSAYGETTGIIFVTFYADGRFTQRMVIPAGTIDYVGVYQLSPDGRVLQSTYRDYAPKQSCRYGACYPLPAGVPMNQTMSTYLRWIQPNLFISEDAGGAVRWVRQN